MEHTRSFAHLCVFHFNSVKIWDFVTDNTLSLRLGTDTSLHTCNKLSSSVIGKTNSIGDQNVAEEKRQKPKNCQTCQHLEYFFAFLANLKVGILLPIFSWISEKQLFSWLTLQWIYMVVRMSLKSCCLSHIYKGKFRLLSHQCQISFKEHEIIGLKIDRKSQCWNITNIQVFVMKEANIT